MANVDLADVANYLDAIQLKEKSIEPETRNNKLLTRNLQLGNITPKESMFHEHSAIKAMEMIEFPYNEGGWLSEEIGLRNLKKLEMVFVITGSRNMDVRRINQTSISDSTVKDTSKKPFFSGLFGN